MNVVSNLIDLIIQALYFVLFIRVILSWIPINPYNPVVELLNIISDPLLRPFQNILPPYKLGIDISPIFAAIALGLFRKVLWIFFGL